MKIDTSAEVARFLAKGGSIARLKPSHTKPPKTGVFKTGNHHRTSRRLQRELSTTTYVQREIVCPTVEQFEAMDVPEMLSSANAMIEVAGLEPIPAGLPRDEIVVRFKAALAVVDRLSE